MHDRKTQAYEEVFIYMSMYKACICLRNVITGYFYPQTRMHTWIEAQFVFLYHRLFLELIHLFNVHPLHQITLFIP